MTPQRKHLDDYSSAHTDLDLTDAAINLLERVNGTARIVSLLKKSQQKHLAKLDAAAEKLGAPYPAPAE